jgi:hypothetical protein
MPLLLAIPDWLISEHSVTIATWGLVLATLGLVVATFFLYLDSRSRGVEQSEQWKRDEQLRDSNSKPKAIVEIAKHEGSHEVFFQCFNLGSTTFFISSLILTIERTKTVITVKPDGPPVLQPGTSVSIPFDCSSLLMPDGGMFQVNSILEIVGASGTLRTDPVLFYYYSNPGEMKVFEWRIGRLSDRQPGVVVEPARRIPE